MLSSFRTGPIVTLYLMGRTNATNESLAMILIQRLLSYYSNVTNKSIAMVLIQRLLWYYRNATNESIAKVLIQWCCRIIAIK